MIKKNQSAEKAKKHKSTQLKEMTKSPQKKEKGDPQYLSSCQNIVKKIYYEQEETKYSQSMFNSCIQGDQGAVRANIFNSFSQRKNIH